MKDVIAGCCQLAREILEEHDLDLGDVDGGITNQCPSQPHLHKKGIMFTSFIVSIVISVMLGVD